MRLVDTMLEPCVSGGAPAGRMERTRSRPPAAPARLVLVSPLVFLLVFLHCLQLSSSYLHTTDASLDRFREGMDVGTVKLVSGRQIDSSPGVETRKGWRLDIRRLLQDTPPKVTEIALGLAPGPAPDPNTPHQNPNNKSHTEPNGPISGFSGNGSRTTPQVPEPGLPESPNSGSTSTPETHKSKNKWYLYLIAGVIVVVVLSLILVLFLHRKDVKAVKPWKTGLSGQLTKALVTGAQSLKRADVETACESFSNIIGTLSDATVYKGTLSSGIEIAVSVIKANKHWATQSKSQFKKKVALLSKVNHKNFVNLIGYCEENDPFSRMLIFEYAPNGTLFEHLHIRESQDLSWASRLRIAMGVAYCLQHMHHQLNPPIILKNLDSNVIYLTDDFAAKVADMELTSKTAEGSADRAVTKPSETSQPPEMPDKESIVHKFGIVLLELLSGRPPYSDENHGLVSWASDFLRGGKPLKEMIDPVLNKVREEDVKPFFEVVKDCLKPNPWERPTMDQVAARLKLITGISQEGAAPKLSPLWWAELEIISSEAT